MAIALHLRHFRFGKDDGTESTHTFYAAEDAAAIIPIGSIFLLRIGIQEEGGSAAANLAHQFQYNKNGAGWVNVTTSSAVARAVTPISFANDANSTKRLSLTGSNDATNSNCTTDGSSGGANNDVPASGHSETVCAIQLVPADVAAGDTIQFRVTVSGPTTTLTVDVTPSLTVTTRLAEQNFEGTGFDGGETWIAYGGTSGAADPDYTVGSIRGAQSLRMKDDGGEGTYAVVKFASDVGVGALKAFFRIKFNDLPGPTVEVFKFYNVQGPITSPGTIEPHETLMIDSSGKIHMYGGSQQDNSGAWVGSTQLQVGTVYYFWMYLNRTTADDGNGWLKIATTTTMPEANEIEWSNNHDDWITSAGVNALGFTTMHGSAYEFLVDQVIADLADIGSLDAAGSTITSSLDSLIQRTGIAQTTSLGALIQASKSATLNADALVAAVKTGLISLDALAQAVKTQSISADALLQMTKSGALSVDAFLYLALSTSSDLDAFLAKTFSGSVQLDAILAGSLTSSALLDALIQATKTGTASLDALLVIAGESLVSASLDGLIQAIKAGTISLDAMIQAEYVSASSLDAVLFLLGTQSISMDALIQGVPSGFVSLDAILQAMRGQTVSLDALVGLAGTGFISMDAILYLLGSTSAQLDGLLSLSKGFGVGMDAVIGVLTIVCPRLITVARENRIVTVPKENRIVTVMPN